MIKLREAFYKDKLKRRSEQFKFFGLNPKRNISMYAKKPHIKIKMVIDKKVDNSRFRVDIPWVSQNQLAMLQAQAINASRMGAQLGARKSNDLFGQASMGSAQYQRGMLIGSGQSDIGNIFGGLL